jgi:hypothetical protein
VGLEIKGMPSDPNCMAFPEVDRNSAAIPDDVDAEFAGNLTVSPRTEISMVSGILCNDAVGGLRRKGAIGRSFEVTDWSPLSRDIASQEPLGS